MRAGNLAPSTGGRKIRADLDQILSFPSDDKISLARVVFLFHDLENLTASDNAAKANVSVVVEKLIENDLDFDKLRDLSFDVAALLYWPGYAQRLQERGGSRELRYKYVQAFRHLYEENKAYVSSIHFDRTVNEFVVKEFTPIETQFLRLAQLMTGYGRLEVRLLPFRRITESLLVASLLTACSGGGSGGPAPSVPGAVPTATGSSAGPTPGVSAAPATTPTATHAPGSPSASPIVSATPAVAPTASAVPTAAPSAAPSSVATNGPALTIAATSSRLAISPDIYGVTIFWNSSTPSDLVTFAKNIALPANRYGGDATTRYNWNVDSSNAGSDWYFMAGNGQSTVTPGASVDTVVNGNGVNGTKSIITVPIIDYVNAKAATNCSYQNPPVSNQVSVNGKPAYNPYVTLSGGVQCGSGSNASGYINDADPQATDVANSPSLQGPWIAHFRFEIRAGCERRRSDLRTR
jgi:hypothetical protein